MQLRIVDKKAKRCTLYRIGKYSNAIGFSKNAKEDYSKLNSKESFSVTDKTCENNSVEIELELLDRHGSKNK